MINSQNGKKSAVDPSDYSRLVKSVELREIFLIGSTFNLEPEAMDLRTRGSKTDSLKLGFELKKVDIQNSSQEGIIAGFFDWVSEIKKSRRKIYKLEARYIIVYSSSIAAEDDVVEAFVQKVGKLATYPYFRALVTRLNSEAHLDLPPLPTLVG